ncbi:MAG TPA: Gfo/Idh/MocA family oxidoreductase [Chitinophagales bacterium]|nr:Gfo/Idh/MocA family oxidoreductase [Chitinophagales bacterium]
MKKITFAIVGFGHIGKRHAQMIAAHPEAELVGIADINESERSNAAPLNVPYFDSMHDLLAAKIPVSVICICTPNGLHAPLAIAALENGCHVVVEKPMGLTKASCEEVIFTSLKMSKQVFCVMQNRYSPPSQWLKQVIEENRLGKIFTVQVNCYWNRDDRYYHPSVQGVPGSWKGTNALDGGPLFTQFSHFIDIMYWLFGDLSDIHAQFENNNHRHSTEFIDDSGMVNFHFQNGGMGCFNYSTAVWDKNLESSITIIGEYGSIKVGGQYMDQVEYCHIKDYILPEIAPVNPPNDYGAYKGSAANHHFVIQNVIDTLLGRSTITTNALEGMKVVEIIERIYALRK